MGLSTGVIDLPMTTPLKKDSPSLRRHQLVIAPQLDVEPPQIPHYLYPMLECWLAWSSAGLVQVTTVEFIDSIQKMLLDSAFSQPLALIILFFHDGP